MCLYLYSRDITIGVDVMFCVFILLEMQNVILSDPTWINSEIIWAIDLGGFYFFLPSNQLAKQEWYSGSLGVILIGLQVLSSL